MSWKLIVKPKRLHWWKKKHPGLKWSFLWHTHENRTWSVNIILRARRLTIFIQDHNTERYIKMSETELHYEIASNFLSAAGSAVKFNSRKHPMGHEHLIMVQVWESLASQSSSSNMIPEGFKICNRGTLVEMAHFCDWPKTCPSASHLRGVRELESYTHTDHAISQPDNSPYEILFTTVSWDFEWLSKSPSQLFFKRKV